MTGERIDAEPLKDRLEERKREIRSNIDKHNRRRSTYWLMSILMSIISIGYAIYKGNPLYLAGVMYALTPILMLQMRPGPSEWELLDIEEQIDLLDYEHAKPEQRAERLFKHHQYELKKYYDQTLRHGSGIFLFGIICIAMGFAIIGTTFYLIGYKIQSAALADKLVVGGLGAIGSILSNYIAAIYLKMFTKTTGSLTMFHNRLVVTHHLHYGSFLASKIQDQGLREKTLSAMAINTSKQPANSPSSESDKRKEKPKASENDANQE